MIFPQFLHPLNAIAMMGSIYLTVLEKYRTIIIVLALIVCLCVIIIKLSGWEDA